MQTNRTEKVFFSMSCLRTAHSLRGGQVCCECFLDSRFVTVGLGMFVRFCMLFSNLHETTLFAFLACALFQPNLNKTEQAEVDVKHGSHVKHCS